MIRLRWALLAISIIGTAVTAFIVGNEQLADRRSVESALAAARQSLVETARAIDRTMAGVMPIVEAAAADLEGPPRRDMPMTAALGQRLGTHRLLATLGVAYERFAFDPATRLHAPFVVQRPAGGPVPVQLETVVDYTEFAHRWYGDPILDGKGWNDPHRLEPNGPQLVTYAVPVFRREADRTRSAPIGVVLGGVSLDALGEPLSGLALGRSGYAFVFTRTGRLVNHPRRDLVASDRTVFETAWAEHDATRHAVAIQGIKGQRGMVRIDGADRRQAGWIAFEPIPSVGWTIAAVLYQSDYGFSADARRHRLFAATVTGLLSALGWLLVALTVPAGPGWRRPTILPLATVALLLAGVAVLWFVFDAYPAEGSSGRVSVYDPAAAENYLDSIDEVTGRERASPIRIPTGVFVQSITFESGTDVAVKGYVWQRYKKDLPGGLSRGFRFSDAESVTVDEAYRRADGNEEVIGWSFAAVFRQPFAYSRYPFDRQDVRVHLRHADWLRDVALTPDYVAYDTTDPRISPGVASDIVLPDWDVVSSGFEYHQVHQTTNFGIDAASGAAELDFGISLRRRFVGPFVAYLLPLGVTVAMVYGVLLISSKRRDGDFLGYTAMDVVVGCAALFFVASLQHAALTGEVGSSSVLYFEYFYFALYVAILLVSLNGILLAAGRGGRLIAVRDNLIPKLAFWPAYLFVIFVVTFRVLY